MPKKLLKARNDRFAVNTYEILIKGIVARFGALYSVLMFDSTAPEVFGPVDWHISRAGKYLRRERRLLLR